SLDTNQKVNGIPMYLNDKHITNYIHARGVPIEEARDWAIHGCSQPVSPLRGHYLGMAINTVVPLDLALHDGVSPIAKKKIGIETGDPRTFDTFEKMYEAYCRQHEFVIRRLLRIQRLMHMASVQRYRMPFRSALDLASIRNGKSHLIGGSDSYPLWHMKDRALVDVADSLTAVKTLVFDDKRVSMAELLEAVDSDFAGDRGEEIRRMCLSAPKYGNDIEEADGMLRDIAKFSASVIVSEKNCFGYPYTINRNGVSWHYAAGKGVGAMPNGRKSGTPFADGSLSPMNGMDKHGPTAVLNSALNADFTDALVAILNQKFPLTLVKNPEAMQKVGALTTTFINNGGLHIQFNFVDRNVLLDAKKHPERYRDLVVRVAGYSAYFVNLTPEVQDEILSRTEQHL
ncbi:MAG: pyruvate formate lyase family protein, partial [Chloroflexota bacterium]